MQYRRGGRGYKLEHAGTFRTMREALIRKSLVEDWLAAGKNPRRELRALVQPQTAMSFGSFSDAWLATRVDLSDSTVENYRSHQRRINETFAALAVEEITPADVSDWITAMIADGLTPGTVRGRVGQLRMILDGLDDNPARHRSVRLPRLVKAIREPPDADELLEMLGALKPRYRPAAVLMEQTGMRISEALGMEARDIDRAGLRVRVRPEVAKRARPRWIPVDPWYMDVLAPVARMDRSTVAQQMHAVSRIHPHLLRHRRGTLWHQSGVVAVELASRLGHHKPSMSLDVYSHVSPIHEARPDLLIAALGV